jgi:hypothetical protein
MVDPATIGWSSPDVAVSLPHALWLRLDILDQIQPQDLPEIRLRVQSPAIGAHQPFLQNCAHNERTSQLW